MKKVILTLCMGLGLISNQAVFAKTSYCKQQDQMLAKMANDFWSYSTYQGNYDEEQHDQHLQRFVQTLHSTLKQKQSLDCTWSELQKSITVKTSSDKQVRVFSWDQGTGGTLHEYDNMIQYLDSQKKIHVKPTENLFTGLVTGIHPIHLSSQKTIYAVTSFGAGSNMLHSQSVDLIEIRGTEAKPAPLFQTKKGKIHEIYVVYNAYSVPEELQNNPLIQVNPQTKQIKIPVVIENNEYPEGEVTKRKLTYQYNGKVFQYVK